MRHERGYTSNPGHDRGLPSLPAEAEDRLNQLLHSIKRGASCVLR